MNDVSGDALLEAVEKLLHEGADPNYIGRNGDTALINACCSGRLDIVKLLISNGANLAILGGLNASCLLTACSYEHLDVVKEILSNPEGRALINIVDDNNESPLYVACEYGYTDIVRELLTVPECDPNILNHDHKTALYQICISAHEDWGMGFDEFGNFFDKYLNTLKELLKGSNIRVDPNIGNAVGTTPLHLASYYGYDKYVKELLLAPGCGADPNIPDNANGTPLTWAANRGNLAEIRMLLAGGADPNIVDGANMNALDYAWRKQHSYVIIELEDYFPTLQSLSTRCIKKHKIDITKVPRQLFPY